MSLQLAEQYEDNEQYSEAFDEYKKLHEKDPKDLSVIERLGHLAMLLDKKEDAANYYSKILEFDATNELAYEQLMDIYVNTDRFKYYTYRGNLHQIEQKFEHAINDYKKALANTQEEKDANATRFVLATLYEQTGQNLKAIDEYLKILDFEDTPEEAFLKLANLYLKEDAKGSAIEVLERARKHGYESNNILENLAQIYIRDGHADKAIEITNDELTKVKCLLECDKKDEAFSKLAELEEKYKNNGQYHSLKAQYYYITDDFDKALECVDEFDKFTKNSPLTFQMRALIYENKDDAYNAHLNWGRYNLLRGDKDVAINEFLNAYQLKNNDENLVSTLAMLLEDSGDKNHAMEFYERLSELDQKDKRALEKLAEFRESIGDYRAQCEYLEKLYELDKRNALIIKKLAETYEKIKNKPAAIEYYNKFLEAGKNSPDYDKIKNKVEKLAHTDMQEDEGLIDKIMKWFDKK